MNLSSVITQIVSLFLMMGLGFLCARIGVISPDFRKQLSTLTLHTAAPCVILSSVLSSNIARETLMNSIGVAAFVYLFLIVLAAVLVRVVPTPKEERGLDQLMLIFTNVGFMGIPVVQSLYGAQGVAVVAIFMLFFNLLCFSYGVLLISGNMKLNLRALINPSIFAATLAFIAGFTGLHLPAVVESSLAAVGAMNTPMAMIIIGASICHSDLGEALRNPRLHRVNILRMLVMPLLVLLAMKLLPVDPMLAGISVMMAAMPVAGTCTMLSDIYTPSDMTSAQAIMLSTLISAVTLPLFAATLVWL